MSNTVPSEIESPPVNPKNLIRLGEDFLRASAILSHRVKEGDRHISLVSDLISRHKTSPTGLSSAETAALAKTFDEITSNLPSGFPPFLAPTLDVRLRLYSHTLLHKSRIFAGVELCDEYLDCSLGGFTDTWKGYYYGEPVCIKAVRTRDEPPLKKTEKIYRHVNEEGKLMINPHPNVLPVIEVSKTLSPLCIMSPWMPNGNITQYTKANPGANRLTLLAQVCRGLVYLHDLDILHGNITPNNILITGDGQACLGDFGIAVSFWTTEPYVCDLEHIRYMAPERFYMRSHDAVLETGSAEKESDVYSLAVTSFSVLTGVLLYDHPIESDMCPGINSGVRPSPPKRPSRNPWLQDPTIWNVITAGWHPKPERRCELSVMQDAFLTSSQLVVPNIEAQREQRGRVLLRISSFFQSLRDSDSEAQRRVNEMEKRLEDHAIPDRERLKLFNKLCKTCSRHRIIPKSMSIPDCSDGSVEVECGGFANILQSTYQGRRVAVKVIRVYVTSDLDVILSGFCREGVVWKYLRHPNILPLLGVTVSEHRFALISEWMENGNINDFIMRDRHVNRVELLVDVANGLKHVHDLRVVHGDLKGANILINGDRRACIADFGLSTITGVATGATAGASQASLISNDTLMSFTGGGTRRWMSPEILHPERFGMPTSEDNRPTRQSDCYALGMVIYEVLCGHHPYVEFQSDILAVNAILEGVRPKKPEGAKGLGFSDELWRTVELCWQEDRNARLSVEDILSCLNDAVAFWYMRDY